MDNKKWKVYASFIGLAEVVGLLSGLLSRSGAQVYAQTVIKPPLSPPGWIFPVVWTLLYLAMGYASYLVMTVGGRDAKDALTVYYVQLALNFLWPILFFRFRLYTFAIFELILLIAAVTVMVIRFSHVEERAGYLTLPYLIWLCFALYLNIGVAVLN